MVFSSLTFLIVFFPLSIFLYFLIPVKFRKIRNYFLFALSIIFYSWSEPIYIFLIISTIMLTYILSKDVGKGNKLALTLAVLANILPLIAFKYVNFIITNINYIPGIKIANINISLPVGISFYTFQALSYVIDLYRGKVSYQKNPIYLSLYVLLFPQLIAGPIVRYETIEHEIENRNESWEDFQAGMGRFVVGLAKKVLIANQAGVIVKTIMEQEQSSIGGGLMWLAAFSYAIQIYFDFSGYSDMAIGIGRMFGFHFLENFNYPYRSRSITEFWRRWHISLSTFFRDYVYIPLGGNKVTITHWIGNMLVVWFLTGMWHGPFWNYIIWGMYYCTLIIVEKYILKSLLKRLPSFISWAYTFIMTLIGWMIFMNETNNPSELLLYLNKMILFWNTKSELSIRSLELQPYIPYVVVGMVFSFPVISKLKSINITKKKRTLVSYNVSIIILYLMSIIYIVSESFNPFLYFRF